MPSEAVYAVIEVKPTFDKSNLEYAVKKAASVRRLRRTSVLIPSANGPLPPKQPTEIIAGLIAAKMSWKDGFGKKFKRTFETYKAFKTINFGLATDGYSFDTYESGNKITIGPDDNALIFFLFRLLGKLQSLGTVAAIEWTAYASNFSQNRK